MSFLRTYFKQIVEMRKRIQKAIPAGYAYWCMEDYVLQNGRLYESQPLTDEELGWLFKLINGKRFAVKQCYYNSQLFLMDAKFHDHEHELRYVEGYSIGVIPVQHGWLTLNGKVIDLTMRLQEKLKRQSPVCRNRLGNRVLGEFPADREYFGVIFDTDHVCQEMVSSGTARSLIDDWENQWPLLKAV